MFQWLTYFLSFTLTILWMFVPRESSSSDEECFLFRVEPFDVKPTVLTTLLLDFGSRHIKNSKLMFRRGYHIVTATVYDPPYTQNSSWTVTQTDLKRSKRDIPMDWPTKSHQIFIHMYMYMLSDSTSQQFTQIFEPSQTKIHVYNVATTNWIINNTMLHNSGTVHTKPPATSRVVFYVTFVTVLFHSLSLLEISQLAKLHSQVNMSVGRNMFINGKLDNFFFYTLSVLDWSLKIESECNACNGRIAHWCSPVILHVYMHDYPKLLTIILTWNLTIEIIGW